MCVFQSPTTAAETILYPLLSTAMEGVTAQYMEDCVAVPPAKNAKDSEFGRRLYELTQGLLAPWLLADEAR